jgi:hypothetical protein
MTEKTGPDVEGQSQLYKLTAAVGELTGAIRTHTARLEAQEDDMRTVRNMVAAISKEAAEDRLQAAHDRVKAAEDRVQASSDRAVAASIVETHRSIKNHARGAVLGMLLLLAIAIGSVSGALEKLKEWW